MWCTTLLHYSSLYEETQWYRKKIMGIIYIFSLMTKSKTLPYSMLRTLKNFSLHFAYQKNMQENSVPSSAAYTSQGRLFHLRLSTIRRRVTRLKQFSLHKLPSQLLPYTSSPIWKSESDPHVWANLSVWIH